MYLTSNENASLQLDFQLLERDIFCSREKEKSDAFHEIAQGAFLTARLSRAVCHRQVIRQKVLFEKRKDFFVHKTNVD